MEARFGKGMRWLPGLCGLLVLSSSGMALAAEKSADAIMGEIQKLEAKRDPKCYATASRLEDFMFGTPLTDKARFAKNLLQKQWARAVWQRASVLARDKGAAEVGPEQIRTVLGFAYRTDADGHWLLSFPGGAELRIHKDDKRHYGSVAYALRALLAVQQEAMMDVESDLLLLSAQGVDAIKEALELYTLAVLKVADNKARMADRYELDKMLLSGVWLEMLHSEESSTATASKPATTSRSSGQADLTLIKSIIEQKVASYAAYNQISNQLFVRNLQVYFARTSWPKDPEEAKRFRGMFTETLIAFARDIYKGAEQVALKNGHPVVMESDVHEFAQSFIPHIINDYEDAIFFPNLPRKERVYVEAYDMDAFRDSGIHWRYLQFAIEDKSLNPVLAPDPFAAELIVENIAQFGVLTLRMTGEVGRVRGEKRIASAHFSEAMQDIQLRVKKHSQAKPRNLDEQRALVSASAPSNSAAEDGPGETLFSDLTTRLGIEFDHHSSDWLNRLLRSYLKKDSTTGIITIPPAFGGSGVAAEDINNDGLADLLMLSGRGNKLYLNRGSQRFEDVTEQAGLGWRRSEDNHPGEPRQPLIADLNNDGLQDIVITYVDDSHRVYRNLGDGRFKDVTEQAGLGGKGLVGGPATVFDYDNDGLLDIYITYFGDYIHGVLPTLKRRNDNGLPNRLFRNTGNFRFVDVTDTTPLGHTGWGQAVAHTDLNGDGWQDLAVSTSRCNTLVKSFRWCFKV